MRNLMLQIENYIMMFMSILFVLAGCSNSKLEIAHTVQSGAYQIEILAPDGEFREGDISLIVRATQNGEVVELKEGRIDLHMPAMGAMPRMDTGTDFTKNGDHLEGSIFFEMDGGWQGVLEITTEDNQTINESIRVRAR